MRIVAVSYHDHRTPIQFGAAPDYRLPYPLIGETLAVKRDDGGETMVFLGPEVLAVTCYDEESALVRRVRAYTH